MDTYSQSHFRPLGIFSTPLLLDSDEINHEIVVFWID